MTTLVGTLAADNFISDNTQYDVIYGLDGDDVIIGSYSPVEFSGGNPFYYGNRSMYIEGGAGDDTLSFAGTLHYGLFPIRGFYGSGYYTSFGTISGGRGNDSIYGNNGNDRLFGGDGLDIISGGDGNDLVEGGDGGDSLFGGGGNDVILDGLGDDTAYGEAGNDIFYSGLGNDTMVGGAGNDFIWMFAGVDYAVGDDGNDSIVFGSDGTGQAYGGADADTIIGAGANDYMQGDAGNDMLYGNAGNDTLVGGADADSLTGGLGADYLLGGLGADGFYFNQGDIKAGEFDQIGDFQDGIDFIYLPTTVGAGYAVSNTALGALISVNEGAGAWGVYISGATAAQVQDQIILI